MRILKSNTDLTVGWYLLILTPCPSRQPDNHWRLPQILFALVQIFRSAQIGICKCVYECVDACLFPMLQQHFRIKGQAGCLKEAFTLLLSYFPMFQVSVLLSFVLSAFFVMLKMHIFLFKNANQDHFWSRTYSEVVSLTVLCLRKNHISSK